MVYNDLARLNLQQLEQQLHIHQRSQVYYQLDTAAEDLLSSRSWSAETHLAVPSPTPDCFHGGSVPWRRGEFLRIIRH